MRRFDMAFIRGFWALISPYWSSGEKWAAWGLLTVIIGLNLGIVYINVILNRWMNDFYNAIQNLDKGAFLSALVEFTWIAALYIVTAVYMIYLSQMLQIRWRKWLTNRYLDNWLQSQMYYRLQIFERATDNPDQRISEDISALVDKTLNLGLGLMRAVVTLASFVVILWSLSGPLEIPLGSLGTFVIPGYMVWAAIIYAIVGTILTFKIGGPLITLNFNQQRFEADFRYSMVRLRENSESIAIYGGEAQEKTNFLQRFSFVVSNFWSIMRQQKKLTWFTATYNQLSYIFPLVVAAPRFFSGQIKLGGLMQISQAFNQVHESLSYIINSFVSIAEWKAVVERLLGFSENMQHVHDLKSMEKIKREETDEAGISLDKINTQLPDGRLLSRDVSVSFSPGEAVIISGPSGCGKSTLLRAVAGIWPYGEGTVHMPAGKASMFLSQKPYLPMGTLKDAFYYPQEPGADDGELKELLDACGLSHLADKLDIAEHWGQTLSPGEQQRIAIARVLLHRPDFAFLDEATSSLDETTESRLYELIKQRLPKTSLISISHRSTLYVWHNHQLALSTDGSWKFGSVPEIRPH